MTTRRSHGDGTIRKRSDGRWEARVTVPNGRRMSVYGKTQKEVRSKLRDAQKKLEQGIDIRGDKLTVGAYLDEWIQDVKSSLSPSTHQSYQSYLRTHLIPSLGLVKLTDLKATHVNKMMRDMSDRGLTARTQNYCRAVLRKALNDAIDIDLLSTNAASKSRPVKQDVKQVTPLTPDEVRILLQHTRDHWHGPLFHTAIGTGMRQGELFALRWASVDLENALLKVEHSMQRVDGIPTFVKPKTDKSKRIIALDPSTVDALKRQRANVELARKAAGDRWQEWGLVFPSTHGTPLNASNVTHQFQKQLEEAGLPRQRFHDLRHCTASLIASQGGDIKAIQEALGHSQISLTANTYTHIYDEMRRDTANRIGAALSGSDYAKGST